MQGIQQAVELGQLLQMLNLHGSRLLVDKRLLPCPVAPSVEDTKGLQESVVVLSRILSEAKGIKAQQADLKTQIEAAQQALTQCKEELGVCPVCEKPFSAHSDHEIQQEQQQQERIAA